MSLNYNKYYIGLQREGVSDNFIDFRPRRKHVIVEAAYRPERRPRRSDRGRRPDADQL